MRISMVNVLYIFDEDRKIKPVDIIVSAVGGEG
jgi:hypothetical protein